MPPDNLYVSHKCPYTRPLMSMLANAPTFLQKSIKVTEISGFDNVPAGVTNVPTLIKQDGTFLVGEEVFRYLKRMRQDPSYPETPEMSENFLGINLSLQAISTQHVLALFLIILVAVLVYRYWSSRSLIPHPISGRYW